MSFSTESPFHAPIHAIDLIRKKRDKGTLSEAEIRFLVQGAAGESIPLEQLSAWLMAAWLNGLAPDEIRARFRSACPNARAIEEMVDTLEQQEDVGALGGLAA